MHDPLGAREQRNLMRTPRPCAQIARSFWKCSWALCARLCAQTGAIKRRHNDQAMNHRYTSGRLAGERANEWKGINGRQRRGKGRDVKYMRQVALPLE